MIKVIYSKVTGKYILILTTGTSPNVRDAVRKEFAKNNDIPIKNVIILNGPSEYIEI